MTVTLNRQNNPAYEAMFDDLIQEVFGFSFIPWFEYELWDDKYESYSIIEDGIMLSNVCIFKSDLLINGEKAPAIQFGAVATRKAERGKGLSRLLMEHVLSLYPNTPAYLFANPSVVDFYPKFGFRQVQTYIPEISLELNNAKSASVKCGLDDAILEEILSNRNIYSSVVDCTNSQSIQMFHLIMSYSEDIYYLPNSGVIVAATAKDGRLFLADVVSRHPVTFENIARELPFSGIHTVEFGFCPDMLNVTPTWKLADMKSDPFFVRSSWNLTKEIRFPCMSIT